MSVKASESQKDRTNGSKKFSFFFFFGDSFFLLKTVMVYCLFSNRLWNSVHYQRNVLPWHVYTGHLSLLIGSAVIIGKFTEGGR